MKNLYVILLIIFLLTVDCASSKNDFFSRKYPTENKKTYKSKQGLMILGNTQLIKNKEFFSKHNNRTRRRSYNKHKKLNRYHGLRRSPLI